MKDLKWINLTVKVCKRCEKTLLEVHAGKHYNGVPKSRLLNGASGQCDVYSCMQPAVSEYMIVLQKEVIT